jgi:glycosyltransferase involved in cell wall biosynthesis
LEHRAVKVLELASDSSMEGAGRMIMELIRHADPARVEPEVLTLTGNGDLTLLAMQAGVSAWNWALKGILNPGLLRRMQLFLRAGRYDVIHTHGLVADLYARGVAHNMKLPVISDVGTADGTRGSYRFFIDRWTAEGVTAWVSATHEALNQCMKTGGLPGDRIFVVPPGLADLPTPNHEDLEKLRSKFSIEPDSPILSMNLPGNMDGSELNQLLDILGELIRRVPGLTFLCSGIEASQVMNHPAFDREISAKQLQLIEAIEDHLPALNCSDVVLVPFTNRGFPARIIEAMRAGKGIVAMDRNGVSEFVEQDVHACLVHTGESAEVVQAVSALLSDRKTTATLGQAARDHFLRHFKVGPMVERYTRIYESCRNSRQ